MASSLVKIKVENDVELMRQFRKLGFKVSDLGEVFGEIAQEVTADAKSMAPHRSGRLASDIRPSKAKTRATVAVGRASVPYAGPINYGWARRGIGPSMFMNRAADTKAQSSAAKIDHEIGRMIRSCGLH